MRRNIELPPEGFAVLFSAEHLRKLKASRKRPRRPRIDPQILREWEQAENKVVSEWERNRPEWDELKEQ